MTLGRRFHTRLILQESDGICQHQDNIKGLGHESPDVCAFTLWKYAWIIASAKASKTDGGGRWGQSGNFYYLHHNQL